MFFFKQFYSIVLGFLILASIPLEIEASNLRVGDHVPQISGKTYDGQSVSVSRFRGKVVLVDFWATWCSPCMMEIPNLRKTYSKYHNQGFEIVGVSFDYEEAPLREFYENPKYTVPWKSIYEEGAWQSTYAKEFEIKGIPYTILVDQEGKIAALDLQGRELNQKIEELLKEKSNKPDAKPGGSNPHEKQISSELERAITKEDPEQLMALINHEDPAIALEAGENFLKQDNLTPENAKSLAELFQGKFGPQEYGCLDTAAYAYYKANMPTEALALQLNNYKNLQVDAKKFLASLPEEQQPAAQNDVLLEGTYMTMTVRLALYQAANGNIDEAKKLISEYTDHEEARGYLYDLDEYAQLQGLLNGGSEATSAFKFEVLD